MNQGNFINKQNGFTLVETAIVLMIVGLLLGGMLVPLSAQMEQRNISDTRKTLDEIQQALIGFAIVNGRLPCPASSTSNGAEDPAGGTCNHPYDGFVPAATLGLSGTDSSGFAVDAWNNRIRFAVTQSNSKAFTTSNGMRTTGLSTLNPDLLVCSSSTASGFNGSSCGVNNALTSSPGVPVVIFSTGKNGANSGGADEIANLAGNKTFISHNQVQNGFDDLVVWISPNILFNRMVATGMLP
jgi:prepilin-type N-terminal cleavage/methylation domain-containing protein